MATSIKTTAGFLRPFQLPSFNETLLHHGEYETETQLLEPVDWIEPGRWTSSVLVRLHPRASHPELDGTLTAPLAELEYAVEKEKLTGKALMDYFLEGMLADPMIPLVMQADWVDESDLRDLSSVRPKASHEGAQKKRHAAGSREGRETGDEGPRTGSGRPGMGE